MRKTLNIVGIGGSIAPPNPRLPAYIMPALSFGNDLLLTSSKNGTAEYNTESDEEKQRVHFNTEQKILLLEKFIKMFYPSQPISVEYTEETDEIELSTWISLWDKMENQLTSEEKTYILTILNRYNQSDTLDKAKAYTIRHAFWFKDISIGNSLNLDIYHKFQSIGGPPEKFFNIIRDKVVLIPTEELEILFNTSIMKRKVHKIIHPFQSKVVPYGEATRKSGKKRISTEYPIDSGQCIENYYEGTQQKKACLHSDIEIIHQKVNPKEYQEFWNQFQSEYHINLKNN